MSSYRSASRIPKGLRTIAIVLALVVGMHGVAPSSFGYPIQSEPVAMADSRAADLASIQQMLELKVVQHRLDVLGFTQDEIAVRLAMASDADLHQMATQSESMLAGGDSGLVIAVLVIVLLVLLILRLTSTDTRVESDMLVA